VLGLGLGLGLGLVSGSSLVGVSSSCGGRVEHIHHGRVHDGRVYSVCGVYKTVVSVVCRHDGRVRNINQF